MHPDFNILSMITHSTQTMITLNGWQRRYEQKNLDVFYLLSLKRYYYAHNLVLLIELRFDPIVNGFWIEHGKLENIEYDRSTTHRNGIKLEELVNAS